MKNIFLISLFIFSSITMAAQNGPYKIVIVADENAAARAGQFSAYLRSQPPFNRIAPEDLQITIRSVANGSMNCASPNAGANEQRLVTCDQRFLRRVQRQEGGNFAVAITSFPSYYGGSGGQIPAATTGSPDRVILHEMLHTYGCEDEYPYAVPDEANRYCRPGRPGPNMAFFGDIPPYASDAAARSTHAGDVPWMGRIRSEMPITQGPALGSPSRPSVQRGQQQIGLHRGGNCPDRDGKKSWKPYQTSIMNGHEDDYVYPIYADIVTARIRRSLGREPRMLAAAAPQVVRPNEVTIESAIPENTSADDGDTVEDEAPGKTKTTEE
jgi:hypothetical protein